MFQLADFGLALWASSSSSLNMACSDVAGTFGFVFLYLSSRILGQEGFVFVMLFSLLYQVSGS